MKARLIKNDQGLWLLFNDGKMKEATKNDLLNFLCFFKLIRCLKARSDDDVEEKRWDGDYMEMSDYPGETIAHITDGFQLVLFDFKEFEFLFDDIKPPLESLVNATEYARINKRSPEQVKVFCRTGRIPGAKKIGRDWVLPSDAPYPADNRYRNKKI